MESYVSVRIEPVNAVKYAGHTAEARRHKVPSYVDLEKVKNNVNTTPEISASDLRTHIENLRERTGQQKLRKDARLAFSGIITFSHEAQAVFDQLQKSRQIELYKEICDAIAEKHNTTVLSMSLHADETAPHAHFMLCAYDKNGKALRLNPKDTSELQDVAGAVLERNGIEIKRGKKISQRIAEAREAGEVANIRHKSVAQLHDEMSQDIKKQKTKTTSAEKKVKQFTDYAVYKKMNMGTFLESIRYVKNEKESTASSQKYEKDSDIIIVKKSINGDFIYFNATNDRDCGTIIDFCKYRNIDIKQAFANKTIAPTSFSLTKKAQENDTMTDITKEFSALAPYDLSYLTKARGIEPALIRQFEVKKDKHGNACFAHRNAGIATGWEVKNEKFTGFSADGHRNLGIAKLGERIENIIVCESFIDAMSYAQLYNSTNSVFVSTGGTLTEKQLEQIKALTSAYSNATVVIATDADEAGDAYETKIAAMAPAAERHRPLYGKDWNDELRERHSRARSAAQRP
jgi:hypothetical protein